MCKNTKQAAVFNCVVFYKKSGNDNYSANIRSGSSVAINGGKLKKSYESGVCFFSNGRFKKEINFGNSFTWDLAYLSSYISETDKIDFDDLNDTVIATVEYKDGSIIKRSFNIEFDKNGVAHFSELEIK